LDLLGDSALLASLADLIEVGGGSVDGESAPSVVVAAPHHCPSGARLAAGHDVDTGPIAREVARVLGGRYVVASELRTFVDLNKEPRRRADGAALEHPGDKSGGIADEALKLLYQSQLFHGLPRTVVEIHGFNGAECYDVELSTGLSTARHSIAGPAWGRALAAARETLTAALAECSGPWGAHPRVGVHPLDPQVTLRGGATFTFERVSRLRLLGLDVHGLHVELGKPLRVGPQVSTRTQAALSRAIARAVEAFRAAAPAPAGWRAGLIADILGVRAPRAPQPDSGAPFVVRKCLEVLVGTGRLYLPPADMARLGLTEGGMAWVTVPGAPGGHLHLPIAPGDHESGAARLESALRRRLDVRLGDRVLVSRGPEVLPDPPGTPAVVLTVRQGTEDTPVEIVGDGAESGRLLLRAASGRRLEVDAHIGCHRGLAVPSVILGWREAQRLGVTFGDVLWIEGPAG
jgi:hypothetical protein